MRDWLASVPYGGYQDGSQPECARVGLAPIVPVTVALTVLGLGLFGGIGAAIGWIGWRSQTAMLVGALAGLATPPLASAVLSATDQHDRDAALPPPPPGGVQVP